MFAGHDVPLVECRQQDRVDVDRPDPIVGFLIPDLLINHRVRDVHEVMLETKCSAGGVLLTRKALNVARFAFQPGDKSACPSVLAESYRRTGTRMPLHYGRLLRRGTAFLALAASLGCPQSGGVWVADDGRVEHLDFAFSSHPGAEFERPVRFLVVATCKSETPDDRLWYIDSPARPPMVKRIRYGVAPEGFTTVTGPKPLRPGCFVVSVGGSHDAVFVVDSSGRVSPKQ